MRLMAFASFISLKHLSEFNISWKNFKNILFCRLSANKTGKTALRNILSFAFSWFTAVLAAGEMTPRGKKEKPQQPTDLSSSPGALNVKLCKVVKTKKRR